MDPTEVLDEQGRPVLKLPGDAVADLRALASAVPSSRTLVDELLEDRRRAAACGE